MRTIKAVVDGSEATWDEPSFFPESGCLRLWCAGFAPWGIRKLRWRLPHCPAADDERVFAVEPKAFGSLRPTWVPGFGAPAFRDAFKLREATLRADGYYKPTDTTGPLLVGRLEDTGTWLGAALKEDRQEWSLNLRLVFGKQCHEVDECLWELPS